MPVGVDIRLEIDDAEFKRYMRQAEKNAKNLGPFFRQAGVLMLRSFDQNFRAEGRPKRWRRLSPNTVAGRRKGSSKVLQDTGMMRMSVMARSAAGNIHKQGKDYLKMGTRLKVASYHQYGTRPYDIVPRNKKVLRFMTTRGPVFTKHVRHPGLVARPFIMIQDEDEREIVKLAAKHVIGEE